jgi:hypothetical protein
MIDVNKKRDVLRNILIYWMPIQNLLDIWYKNSIANTLTVKPECSYLICYDRSGHHGLST